MTTTQAPQDTIGLQTSLLNQYNKPKKFYDLFPRVQAAETIEDWSEILADYISWGNRKISGQTAIINLNAANDCPNKKTQEEGESKTGLCQVEWDMCYAGQAEKIYENTIHYRRRQEFLWDCLDPETFAKAFLKVVERKITHGNLDDYSDVDLRFSEAGDFRRNQDVYKADRIAEILHDNGISAVYTYSASYKLSAWHDTNVDNLIVMQSVNEELAGSYGDKEYKAFELTQEDIENADRLTDLAPDNSVWCPHDLEKRQKDVPSEDAISCGDCRLCLEKEGPDVSIPIHK